MMCGIDLPVPQCEITVHLPRIKDIGMIGEQDFFIGAQCLTINSSMFVQDKALLEDINNFQIFMTIMNEKESKDKKNSTLQVLQILFPNHKPMMTPRSLILMREGKQTLIDENNFEHLQDVLRLGFCTKTGSMDQQAFNPANDKAREIAQKLMRGRERIAAEHGSSNTSNYSQYFSVLTVRINSMSLKDMADLTIYQLYDLVERYNLYLAWDIDVRSRLAGGKPDKHPDNWMKKIH